jgi:outer membrane receptor protein involved in Fe transport
MLNHHRHHGDAPACSPQRSLLLSIIFLLALTAIPAASKTPPGDSAPGAPPRPIGFTVNVFDRDLGTPLELVRVILRRDGSVIGTGTTNAAGRALFRDVEPGWYVITTRLVGYTGSTDSVLVDSAHVSDTIRLGEVSREQIVVTAPKPFLATTVDLRNGNQTFEGETYHAPPASRMTQLVQQNLAGAARAPTGEVHVRGQHGEFTYYVDGIPIPLGVFGGLNEVVDPKVIDRATFYTGGFPAEYGGQMSSIIDVQTRVPSGHFHMDFSAYGGSYLTSGDSLGSRVGALRALNSNGQSLSISDHVGNLGLFLSGSRQETDRRIDQPVPELFHDHGFDYFLYGKANYVIGSNDYLALNLNYGVTHTEVPYDSSEGIGLDLQHTYNAFQTLSFYHTFSTDADRESNFFAGVYAREGGLTFTPSLDDQPKQYIGSDTNGYVVAQDRAFTTLGFRTKYDARLSHQFGYAVGLDLKSTIGSEAFDFLASEASGPRTSTDFSGADIAAFAQSEIHPLEWTRLDLGLRWDRHTSPDLSAQSQISPRVKVSFLPDEANTFYLYYGRLFIPTNVEGLQSVATLVGDSATGTLPQRESLYEAAYMRNWGFGLTSKLAAFFKDQSPGIDDETLGSSTIRVNVNIDRVRISGVELALAYGFPESPFSAFVNAALIHAYGIGPVSGGFLPADSSSAPFDLDHDQRLSLVIGANYQPGEWFASLTATYGSGLANGNDEYAFSTGLLDFNQGAHTTPSWIVNVSAGYTFDLGNGHTIEPSLYITNILDHQHPIKGAFFSGASFEEPRNVVLRLNVHI